MIEFKIIKTGVTRLVILIGSIAFKLPRFDYGWGGGLRGLLANMQEKTFHTLSDKACPVLFSIPGGWLIVMPRCQPLTDDQWNDLQSQGVYDYLPIPVEFKRDSFGVLNNEIVAVDYGS